VAGAVAFGLSYVIHVQSIVDAVIVLGGFGLVYLGATTAMRVPESKILLRKLRLAR